MRKIQSSGPEDIAPYGQGGFQVQGRLEQNPLNAPDATWTEPVGKLPGGASRAKGSSSKTLKHRPLKHGNEHRPYKIPVAKAATGGPGGTGAIHGATRAGLKARTGHGRVRLLLPLMDAKGRGSYIFLRSALFQFQKL